MKPFMFKLSLFMIVFSLSIIATAVTAVVGDYFTSVCCGIATAIMMYIIKIASDEDKANVKAGE